MKKKIISITGYVFILFLLCFFQSCASKKIVAEKIDLYGLVVDENNKPVKDFIIRCKKVSDKNEKEFSTMTGMNGVFMLNDLRAGEYLVYGEKNGYAILAESEQKLFEPQKMICFQVSSIDNVLNNVEKQFLLGNIQHALELLDEVKVSGESYEEYVVQNYKSILMERL